VVVEVRGRGEREKRLSPFGYVSHAPEIHGFPEAARTLRR